jgi:hypothetical protein
MFIAFLRTLYRQDRLIPAPFWWAYPALIALHVLPVIALPAAVFCLTRLYLGLPIHW